MAISDLIPWRRSGSIIPGSDVSPMMSLQRDINRMFEEFWNTGSPRLMRNGPQVLTGSFIPELDISETDKNVELTAEVPGMTEKEIKLTLADDGETLHIEGEKHVEHETKEEGVYFAERRFGKFRRSVMLPSRVDPNQVEATCRNGVLRVHMRKLPEQQQHTKQIPVKSA